MFRCETEFIHNKQSIRDKFTLVDVFCLALGLAVLRTVDKGRTATVRHSWFKFSLYFLFWKLTYQIGCTYTDRKIATKNNSSWFCLTWTASNCIWKPEYICYAWVLLFLTTLNIPKISSGDRLALEISVVIQYEYRGCNWTSK